MDPVPQPAGTPRGFAIRIAGRPPLRIRLPGRVTAAAAPRAWFRLTRLSLAASTVLHTAAVAALLQVTGVGDRAARAAGEIIHVVYLGRMAEPKPQPPPPPPPVPRAPEPVRAEPAAVVMPDPPPPAVTEPVPIVLTNAVPVEPPPAPPPPAAIEAAPPPGEGAEEPAAATAMAPEQATAMEDGPAWDAIRTAIHRHLAYPDSARRRGEEGRVVLQLIVGREGRLEQAGVLAEGASDRLAAAALTAARRAAPFDSASRGEFRIPIVFRLSPAAGL
ncbi:MAG: TonB family protein [Lentisphaerae bacterium]|nr:TonB family protein [Lentisphaerota bacterium]